MAAVLAHLVLAPATLALAGALVVTGRLTRWRPQWLAVPAAGGAAWTAAAGVPRVLGGLAAGPRHLLAYLAGVPGHPAHLRDAAAALAQAAHGLPAQVPAGLLAAAAEAAVVAWLSGGRPWRPGLIAVLRRYRTRAVLAAGHAATRTGFCLGVDPASGRPAELSWAGAAGGVLVSCAGPDSAARLCLPAACAALARRMTLVVVDLTASDWLAADLTAACATAAAPLTWLRPAPPGRWVPAKAARGRAAGDQPAADQAGSGLDSVIGQAVRNREVVVAGLDPAMPGPAAAAAAGSAVGSLSAVLRGLREQGLRGDCLAWVHGCEVARPPSLAGLLELGTGTGTAILLSTASAQAAARLAGLVAAVVAGGPADPRLAARLTGLAAGSAAGPAVAGLDEGLRGQPAGEFTMLARGTPPRRACRPGRRDGLR
ncbi:MAG TPA: hypothetical protein VFV41_20340 [Streptosporangiaceae bacterium]|nr:hypothetical protein [Streptosporangiaceae bacterium]